MDDAAWKDPERRRLAMVLGGGDSFGPLAILINGDRRATGFALPSREWISMETCADARSCNAYQRRGLPVDGRMVEFAIEVG